MGATHRCLENISLEIIMIYIKQMAKMESYERDLYILDHAGYLAELVETLCLADFFRLLYLCRKGTDSNELGRKASEEKQRKKGARWATLVWMFGEIWRESLEIEIVDDTPIQRSAKLIAHDIWISVKMRDPQGGKDLKHLVSHGKYKDALNLLIQDIIPSVYRSNLNGVIYCMAILLTSKVPPPDPTDQRRRQIQRRRSMSFLKATQAMAEDVPDNPEFSQWVLMRKGEAFGMKQLDNIYLSDEGFHRYLMQHLDIDVQEWGSVLLDQDLGVCEAIVAILPEKIPSNIQCIVSNDPLIRIPQIPQPGSRIGNLRDSDWDYRTLWKSERFYKLRKIHGPVKILRICTLRGPSLSPESGLEQYNPNGLLAVFHRYGYKPPNTPIDKSRPPLGEAQVVFFVTECDHRILGQIAFPLSFKPQNYTIPYSERFYGSLDDLIFQFQ